MTKSEIALELYTIAEELAAYEVDNGPMGSSKPFIDEARRLRTMAKALVEGVLADRAPERSVPGWPSVKCDVVFHVDDRPDRPSPTTGLS